MKRTRINQPPHPPSPVPETLDETNKEALAEAAKPHRLTDEIKRGWQAGKEIRYGSARERADDQRQEAEARLTHTEAAYLTPAQQLAHDKGIAETAITEYVRLMRESEMTVRERPAQTASFQTIYVKAGERQRIVNADPDRLAISLFGWGDSYDSPAWLNTSSSVDIGNGSRFWAEGPLFNDVRYSGELWVYAESDCRIEIWQFFD